MTGSQLTGSCTLPSFTSNVPSFIFPHSQPLIASVNLSLPQAGTPLPILIFLQCPLRYKWAEEAPKSLYVIVCNTLSICHEDLFALVFARNTVLVLRVCYFSDNLSFSFHEVHIQFEESLFAVGCPLLIPNRSVAGARPGKFPFMCYKSSELGRFK